MTTPVKTTLRRREIALDLPVPALTDLSLDRERVHVAAARPIAATYRAAVVPFLEDVERFKAGDAWLDDALRKRLRDGAQQVIEAANATHDLARAGHDPKGRYLAARDQSIAFVMGVVRALDEADAHAQTLGRVVARGKTIADNLRSELGPRAWHVGVEDHDIASFERAEQDGAFKGDGVGTAATRSDRNRMWARATGFQGKLDAANAWNPDAALDAALTIVVMPDPQQAVAE